jgi:2-haloacid dehalogenase
VIKALVFDVNETLLDLSPMRDGFFRGMGSAEAMAEWFARLLHSSLVATLVGLPADFGLLAGDSLDRVARRRGIELDKDAKSSILSEIRRLPPYVEVPSALRRLRAAGFSMAALTNSTLEAATDQLTNAGLIGEFDRVLSVEAVGKFKPAPEPYLMAAERLGVAPSEMRMIAAHDWDVLGAIQAGCAAAFVARPGQYFTTLADHPDIVGRDLAQVADLIIRLDLV